LVQAALEAETTEAIGAAKGERSETRLSHRSGYYSRSLIIRVGTCGCGCRRIRHTNA
jgi:transposase-like protein